MNTLSLVHQGSSSQRVVHTFIAIFNWVVLAASLNAASRLNGFVKVQGDQLVENGKPFRFLSWNIPNLQLVEDNVPFININPWRLPNRFELTDALATVRQMGGTVVRTYVLSVVRTNDTPGAPRHVLGPGQFNEEAFRALDLALQIAAEQGVRVIIPLVDNWTWQGGRAEYAGFRKKPKDAFWTDPQIIADFKETIRFVVNRTNSLTGLRYSDDPAVLCWETGNELDSPPEWTRQIASYIKELDLNHLVMDGFGASELRQASLEIPEVDIVTTHHYPGPKKAFYELIYANREQASGKKPYVVGEFGFVGTDDMERAINAIVESGASGGLLWSLRFRNRDGGFYWHSEPAGGNKYKAFHWPGSPMGDDYDETRLMTLVRHQAYKIREEPEPPLPVPAAPELLQITDPAFISWRGSVGASDYVVERSRSKTGEWSTLADRIDESFTQYRPQFADETAPEGKCYYRVRARNVSGLSAPSNVIGPVMVHHCTLIDELPDFSKTHEHQGALEIRNRDCRQAKEDAHRAHGKAGSAVVYRVPRPMSGFRVFAFYPKEIVDLKFSESMDGQAYHPISVQREDYFQGSGDYNYWKPVLYRDKSVGKDLYLRIEFCTEAEIGRVEITYAADRK